MSNLPPPATGNEAVDDLLQFYRFRMDEFEKERSLHLQRLSSLEPQKEELHRLRWEASTRDTELLNLRKSVSDAQITVHRERETSNDQGAIITRLKSQQVEDRKRIQRLLALTQPVVSDITFLKEGSSAAGDALSQQYRVALHNAEVEMEKQSGDGILSAQAVASRLQARNESLQMTIDSLKDQLNSYKSIARDKISSLYEDRNIRESQFQKTTENLTAKVEILTKKLKGTEDNLHAVTRDYLVLRHNAQVAQRVMIEERQQLRSERSALETDRTSAARQMSLEMEAAREANRAEIELAVNDFRSQVQSRERDMSILREQYEQVQGVYGSRVRDLTQQVDFYRNKFASVNRRRKLEIQGSKAQAENHRREVEGLKNRFRRKEREDVRGGLGELREIFFEEESDGVDLEENQEFDSENNTPNSGDVEDVKTLKGRVVDMERQIKNLLEQQR
ncbi:hypothetical protein TL16_g08770 [Triparma laevis f. inornata]|uniref:Uncharacterized protein n=2 Tax=Triparma laevis TaxID=1534972 RepID=A0A9W7FCG7_9STRA|nr:hypothetical protein TL16_g08770 [Triparma laevis f. inornata]GMI09614.1 hypothetical protein TrLO_g6563 [Triparma laevis f. longispina]